MKIEHRVIESKFGAIVPACAQRALSNSSKRVCKRSSPLHRACPPTPLGRWYPGLSDSSTPLPAAPTNDSAGIFSRLPPPPPLVRERDGDAAFGAGDAGAFPTAAEREVQDGGGAGEVDLLPGLLPWSEKAETAAQRLRASDPSAPTISGITRTLSGSSASSNRSAAAALLNKAFTRERSPRDGEALVSDRESRSGRGMSSPTLAGRLKRTTSRDSMSLMSVDEMRSVDEKGGQMEAAAATAVADEADVQSRGGSAAVSEEVRSTAVSLSGHAPSGAGGHQRAEFALAPGAQQQEQHVREEAGESRQLMARSIASAMQPGSDPGKDTAAEDATPPATWVDDGDDDTIEAWLSAQSPTSRLPLDSAAGSNTV